MATKPRKYETLYLVRPDISPEDLSTIQSRVEQSVANNGGEMIKSEKWAERDLAYSIDNYTRGIYHIAVYSAEPGAVKDIEKYFTLSKNNVLRFMTVNYVEPKEPAAGFFAAGGPAPSPPLEASKKDGAETPFQSGFSAPNPAEGGA